MQKLLSDRADLPDKALFFLLKKCQAYIRAARLAAQLLHGFVAESRLHEQVCQTQDHRLHPLCGKKRFFIRNIVIRGTVFEPCLRRRVAAGLFTQLQDQRFQLTVVRPRTEIGNTSKKGRIFFRILFLQKVLQDLSGDHAALRGFDLSESRIQIYITEIIAQQKCKKAVHGRDLRIMQQDLLPLQMGIGWIQGKSLGQGLADPLPHLRSSCSGKGHNEQAVYIQRMLSFTHQPYDPLHKNSGLAAAGRCRHQYVMITCVQHLLLNRRKLYRHFHSPNYAFFTLLSLFTLFFYSPYSRFFRCFFLMLYLLLPFIF